MPYLPHGSSLPSLAEGATALKRARFDSTRRASDASSGLAKLDDVTSGWHHDFVRDGYAQHRSVVPRSLVDAARAAIDDDLARNFDASRQAEYDAQSSCPTLRGAGPIVDLYDRSPARALVSELVDDVTRDHGQIAIRRAHNCDEELAPDAHIDGFATDENGLSVGRIYSHTLLVGIFLTTQQRAFAGNFTVWPGSHETTTRFFRERGERAVREPMPRPPLGEPRQLCCEVGDVVIAHYALAHCAAVNTSDADRIAVFFRVSKRDIDAKRWHYLTHLWAGWRVG